jgi:pyruvate,water dikinase
VSHISFIEAGSAADVPALGGKGAGLAFLVGSGVRIPPAFVITADGYRAAVSPELRREVAARLDAIPAGTVGAELEEHAASVRDLIFAGTADHALTAEIRAAGERLHALTGEHELTVAVRSSSIAEDAADKSFAGEHDTYLWVRGLDELDRRVRECWASLVTTRAVAYRERDDAAAHEELAMAVVVQQMAPARAAGVFMTLNPVNGDRSKVMIESVWGLGEPLVSGEANPDRFLIDKITGEVVKREIADKDSAAVRDPETGVGVRVVPVEAARAAEPSLTREEIAELLRIARVLERAAGTPQDGEFAVIEGEAPDNVLLVQCRPETVWSQRPRTPKAPGGTAMAAVLATLTQGSRPTSG